MTYGNAYFLGWVRLCVLFVSLLFAVVLRAQYPQTVVTVDISGVSSNDSSYWFTRKCEGKIISVVQSGTAWNVTIGGTETVAKNTGWAGGYSYLQAQLNSSGWVDVDWNGTRVFAVTPGSKLFVRVYYKDNDGPRPMKERVSEPWEPPSSMKLVTWTLVNNTAGSLATGAWVDEDPDWCWVGLPPLTVINKVPPGGSRIVKFYMSEKDTAKVCAGFVDDAATVAAFGKLYTSSTTSWPDGTPTMSRMARRLGTPAPEWKMQSDGEAVLVVDGTNSAGGVAATSPGSSAPITGPGNTVPTGGTGGATGKDISDATNAAMAQAHGDAAKLQSSVEGVKTAIQQQTAAQMAAAAAAGSGTGTGTGGTGTATDSPQAKTAADAAQGTKDSMGDGTSQGSSAQSAGNAAAESGRTNANSVIQQFGTVPIVAEPEKAVPLESITIRIN